MIDTQRLKKWLLLSLLGAGTIGANAATYTVSSGANSGAGTLRQAITDANANPGADVISFAGFSGTIIPTAALPNITEAVTIDGTTATGYAAGAPTVKVQYTGTTLTIGTGTSSVNINGIEFTSGISGNSTGGNALISNGCAGLTIQNCRVTKMNQGFYVTGGSDVTLTNNVFAGTGCCTSNSCIMLDGVAAVAVPNGIAMSGNSFVLSGTLACANGIWLANMNNLSIGDNSVGSANVKLADGSLAGIGASTVLRLTNAGNCSVDNIDFSYAAGTSNIGGSCISANGCANLVIRNSLIATHGTALGISGGSDLQVLNNVFKYNSANITLNGIAASGLTGGVSINGNDFSTYPAGHLLNITGMKNLTIGDNLTNVPAANILLPDGSLSAVNGNTISLTNDTNVVVDNIDMTYGQASNHSSYAITTAGCGNLSIKNSTFVKQGGGVQVIGGYDLQVLNNTFTNAATHGNYCLWIDRVQPVSLAKSISVSGNIFSTTSATGSLASGVRIDNMKNQVIGDNLTNVPTANVLLPDGSLTSVYGNALELNGDTTTWVDNLSVNYASASYNATGILANSCRTITVQNCTATNRGNGIYIQNGADAQVLNNAFGAAVNCLYINNVAAASIPSRVIVNGNTWAATPQSQRGLYMLNMSRQLISDGTVSGTNITIPDGSLAACNTDGILLSNVDSVLLDNIDFGWAFNTTQTGTALNTDLCDSIVVRNSTTDRRATGFKIANGSDAQILNNTFSNNGSSSNYTLDINAVAANRLPKRILVTGNTFTSGNNGIQMTSMTNQTIGDASVSGANVVIADGSFNNFAGSNGILYLNTVNSSVVDNLDLSWTGSGSSGVGLNASSCATLTVQNSTTNKRTFNMTCNNGADIQILNNTIGTSNNRALFLNGVTSVSLPRAVVVSGNTWGTGVNGLVINNMKNQRIGDASLAATSNIVLNDGDMNGYTQYPINFDNVDSSVVDNIEFGTATGTGQYGLFVANSSDVLTVQNCTATSKQGGMYFNGGAELQVLNNSFTSCGSAGSYALYCSGVAKGLTAPRSIIINGNSFSGTCSDGVSISNIRNLIIGNNSVANANVKIGNNTLDAFSGTALNLSNTDSMLVDRLTIGRTTGTGTFGIQAGSGDAIKFQNCNISNRATGLYISGGTDAAITNDTFSNCGTTGYALNIIGVGPTPAALRGISVRDNMYFSCTNGIVLQSMVNQRIGDRTVAGANIVIEPESRLVTCGGTMLNLSTVTASRIDHVNFSYEGTGLGNTGLNMSSCARDTVNQCIVCSRATAINATDSAMAFTSNSIKSCTVGLSHSTGRSIPPYVKLNTFINNGTALANGGPAIDAGNNYWGGSTPASGSANGYTGAVTVTPVLTAEDPGVQVNKGTIVLSTTVISGLTATACTPGAAKTFTASGQCLEAPVVLTAPAGFQLSLDGTAYAANITLPISGGDIQGEPRAVYVRASNMAAPGTYDDTLQATAVYQNPPLLRLQGTVNAASSGVSGNSITITDGSTGTSAGNNTYFNSTLNGNPVSKTFTITNNGNLTMNITGTSITGANAADFSVTSAPAATIAPGGNSTFTVAFNPAALTGNTRTAVVHIASDACATSDFDFTVQGCIPVLATGTMNVSQDVTNDMYGGSNCVNLISRIQPAGANPVTGTVNSKVTIDGSVQSFNGGYYVQRHYDMEPAANAATATANITLYWTQTEFDAYNAVNPGTDGDLPAGPSDAAGIANLRITQYHGTSATGVPGTYSGWNGAGPANVLINPSDANIVYNSEAGRWEVTFPVTGFSGFFVTGFISAPLPVTLFDFTADKAGPAANLIAWHTEAETGGSRFMVEKSSNAQSFEPLGTWVQGKGNHSAYQLTDPDPLTPATYYRLKMMGSDEKATYSKTVSVARNPETRIQISPNPAHEEVTILLSQPTAQDAVICLVNMLGETIKTLRPEQGTMRCKVGLGGIPAGIYTLRIVSGSLDKSAKLFIN